ncbi:MAG: sulfotransferase domain-containing protein, partial [Pirellulaceae bacterium]
LPGLRNWLDFFPPEQLLVVRDEAVKRDLQAVVRQICRFLEVPTFELPSSIHMNVGYYPPMPEDLKRRLEAWYTPHEEALKVFLATHPNKIL